MSYLPIQYPANIQQLNSLVSGGGILNTGPLDDLNTIVSTLNTALQALQITEAALAAAGTPNPILINVISELQTVLNGPFTQILTHMNSQYSSFTRNLTIYGAHSDMQRSLGNSNMNSDIANTNTVFGSMTGGLSTMISSMQELASGDIVGGISGIVSGAASMLGVCTSEQNAINTMLGNLNNMNQARAYDDHMRNPVTSTILQQVATGGLASMATQYSNNNISGLGFIPPTALKQFV